MTPVWAQRREELWSDCLVSPDVFNEMVDRLGEFVMPYQQALETEADPHSMHLYLQGLLSHLPRKNAEAIAAWVEVERQVLQDFIGRSSWIPGSYAPSSVQEAQLLFKANERPRSKLRGIKTQNP
jgi:hypothetical protein